MRAPLGLYIHVPFCHGKCPYCDFYSVMENPALIKQYTQALINQIAIYNGKALPVDTCYLGGGTPPLLGIEYLQQITAAIKNTFVWELPSREWSIEGNPESLTPALLKALIEMGFNRISIGIQSLDDQQLQALGRKHTAEQAKQAVYNAKEAGFKNISIEFMLGIPGQDIPSLQTTLRQAAELPITHLSAYMLKIEPGTPFGKNPPDIADDDTQADLYAFCIDYLRQKGFAQYEISNFAKEEAGKDYRCRHNLKYWCCQEYLAMGPGAHGFINGARYCFAKDINCFIQGKTEKQLLGAGGDLEEYIMLRLRLTEGLDIRQAEKKYNISLSELLRRAEQYKKMGYMHLDSGNLSFTQKGFAVSNYLLARLLSE